MTQHTHDPAEGVYATGSDWVHAIEVREPSRFLYVSGTMGLDEAGADVSTQLDLVAEHPPHPRVGGHVGRQHLLSNQLPA